MLLDHSKLLSITVLLTLHHDLVVAAEQQDDKPDHCVLPDGLRNGREDYDQEYDFCLKATDNMDVDVHCVSVCAFGNMGMLDSDGYPLAAEFSDAFVPRDDYPAANAFFAAKINQCVQIEKYENGNVVQISCMTPFKLLNCAAELLYQECPLPDTP